MSFYCYLLCTTSGSHTYVGATTDPDRRLQQHNGEKAGGAHATGIQVARGLSWRRVCIIEGIPEWRTALQIEWKWKQLTRLEKKEKRPLPRRLLALSRLLSLEKPTKTAIPYQWYPDGPPQIRWSLPEDEALYLRLTGPKPALLAMPLSLSYRPDPSVSNETESTLPGPSSPPWPHVSPGHLVERRSENESVGDGIEYFPVARTEEEAHGKREA